MKAYLHSVHESAFDYWHILKEIKFKLEEEADLFVETNFEHNMRHKSFIINMIIEEFIRLRVVARARQITLDQQKSFLRQKKTHDITFAGQ